MLQWFVRPLALNWLNSSLIILPISYLWYSLCLFETFLTIGLLRRKEICANWEKIIFHFLHFHLLQTTVFTPSWESWSRESLNKNWMWLKASFSNNAKPSTTKQSNHALIFKLIIWLRCSSLSCSLSHYILALYFQNIFVIFYWYFLALCYTSAAFVLFCIQ